MSRRGAVRAYSHARPWPEGAFQKAVEEAAGAGLAAAGPDGRQSFVSQAFCDLVGWTREELEGAEPPFVYWPPEHLSKIEKAFRATIEGRAPREGFQLQLQRRSGERFDALIRVAALTGPGSEALGWLAFITDISARKRAERRGEAEHEVSRILSRSATLSEAAPPLLESIGRYLDWDVAALWCTGDDAGPLRLVDVWSRPGSNGDALTRGFVFERGQGLPGLVWASGDALWISDLHREGRFLRYPAAQGMRSALLFPVTAGSEVEGVVELFAHLARPADSEMLATTAALGRQLGQFVERRRAQAALRQSAERYRSMVETANEGIWLIDLSGRTLYSNERMSEMLGYSPEELKEFSPLDCCFPEDVETARRRVLANLSGVREQFDGRFRRKDGAELLVMGSTSPLRDAEGRISGALSLFSDVTDRKRAEAAARLLAAIVESSEDAIISKTLDGIIQSWNPAAERIYGYSAAEAVGRSIMILLPPDRPDEETGILERMRRGERMEHFETSRMRKDGRIIQVSMTVSPIYDHSGHIVGISNVTRDITERKLFEEQLRETQKLESLGVLAGGVAHDFNNLLVGILGNASLAMDTVPADNPAWPLLEGVVQASERAAALTGQLLAYSGKGRFVIQPVDISSLVRDIVALLRTSIPRNVELELDLSAGLPTIDADVSQIQQLIMNLVINAAEAIGESHGSVKVRTSSEETNSGPLVRLEVEDDGCGMDEATRERIFEPFFTTKFTGRGLGLAAALGIVRGHNGSIAVETAPGRGSRFIILLAAGRGTAPTAGTVQPQDYRGSGVVLVIDDESVVRQMARLALERFGYRVMVAADGRAGLDRLRETPEISLVLLDLTMPVMSGEQALREIKQLRPELPVVLSSGYTEAEALRRFEGMGLAGFLQKPYTAERLAEKIKFAARASAR